MSTRKLPVAETLLAPLDYEKAWRRMFLPKLWAARAFAAIAMRPRAAALAGRLLGRAPRLLTLAAGVAR